MSCKLHKVSTVQHLSAQCHSANKWARFQTSMLDRLCKLVQLGRFFFSKIFKVNFFFKKNCKGCSGRVVKALD